jgi:hypothetical protein
LAAQISDCLNTTSSLRASIRKVKQRRFIRKRIGIGRSLLDWQYRIFNDENVDLANARTAPATGPEVEYVEPKGGDLLRRQGGHISRLRNLGQWHYPAIQFKPFRPAIFPFCPKKQTESNNDLMRVR